MASLTVTMKGQVTLKRELLQHLGIKPGERVEFDKLPGGELRVRAARPAVEAGLAIFGAGGDFADGVMAYEGSLLGAETFVSFDEQAVKLLSERGQSARLLRN